MYELFIDSFEALPIAADVNGDYLCMHGGISPDLVNKSDIDNINRFIEPPLHGFLCDLLWADPMDDKEARKMRFAKNTQRECSVKFGLEPVKEVLKKNNFISIIRAHQVQPDGYKMHRWGGNSAFPSVITVFSAPNYCNEYHNKGAVILIENDKMNIKQYKDVPTPFHLPNNMDLFKWSVPFLMEKVSDMMLHIVKKGSNVEDIEGQVDVKALLNTQVNEVLEDKAAAKLRKKEAIRAKVRAIGKMHMILKTLK